MKPEIKIKKVRPYRLTLRIPECLLKKINAKRKNTPVGPINLSQWVLAQIVKGLE